MRQSVVSAGWAALVALSVVISARREVVRVVALASWLSRLFTIAVDFARSASRTYH